MKHRRIVFVKVNFNWWYRECFLIVVENMTFGSKWNNEFISRLSCNSDLWASLQLRSQFCPSISIFFHVVLQKHTFMAVVLWILALLHPFTVLPLLMFSRIFQAGINFHHYKKGFLFFEIEKSREGGTSGHMNDSNIEI